MLWRSAKLKCERSPAVPKCERSPAVPKCERPPAVPKCERSSAVPESERSPAEAYIYTLVYVCVSACGCASQCSVQVRKVEPHCIYAMPNDGAVEVVTVPLDEINTFAGMRLEIEEVLSMAKVTNEDGDGEDDNEFQMGLPVKVTRNLPTAILRVGPTFRTKLTIDEVAERLNRYFDWTPFCILPAKR